MLASSSHRLSGGGASLEKVGHGGCPFEGYTLSSVPSFRFLTPGYDEISNVPLLYLSAMMFCTAMSQQAAEGADRVLKLLKP